MVQNKETQSENAWVLNIRNNSCHSCNSPERKDKRDRGSSPRGVICLPKKSSRQACIMLQRQSPTQPLAMCIVEFMVPVTPAGCHLPKPRQEAAQGHPLMEVEKYLSPHTFLQSYLKLIWLPKAALGSYSLPSGALGQTSGHWSGLLFLVVFLLIFLFQSQAHFPLLLLALDYTQEAGTAFATSKAFKISTI